MIKFVATHGRSSKCSGRIRPPRWHVGGEPPAPKTIVSYDDTPNDQDALALARVLASAGARLMLAYVRHAHEDERECERLEEQDAEALLERGAQTLGVLDLQRRIVLSGSTAKGLRWLAEQEGAQVIVFGSDYRTAPGHVSPQQSALALLEGGPAAIALAPANYRSDLARTFGRVGLLASPADEAALQTAHDIATSLSARVARDEQHIDLLVVGSRPEAPEGRVLISASAHNAIHNATSPVLVVPHRTALRFPLAARGI